VNVLQDILLKINTNTSKPGGLVVMYSPQIKWNKTQYSYFIACNTYVVITIIKQVILDSDSIRNKHKQNLLAVSQTFRLFP